MLTSTVLFVVLLGSAKAWAVVASAQSSLAITDFTLNGSGCPPGSLSATLSANASSIAVSFSSFTPSVTSANPTYSRQNCQAVVSVAVPAAQQFTVDEIEYAGFVELQNNVSVSHSTSYYFQAQLPENTASDSQQGPVVHETDFTNSFAGTTPIWSDCGVDSVINIDISVALDYTITGAEGFAAVDSAKIGPFLFRSC